MSYQVRIHFLGQRDKGVEEWNYDSLFDAIKVAKESNIGSDRSFKPAFSDTAFNECFSIMLKHGFAHAGTKSPDYPHGNVIVFLLKMTNGTWKPIMPDDRAIVTPFDPSIGSAR
jgi:hypothetical protein